MNKLIIGLLVVAAGAGIYLLLQKKKHNTETNGIKKEWIIGKWVPIAIGTDVSPTLDSNYSRYRYDFQKDGNIVRSLNDSAKADTTHYEWNKADQLVLKEKTTDSSGKTFYVIRLTADSLRLQAADSSIVLFTKLK